MAADGVFGKVKLEFNSLISFATAPQAFIAVALNPGGNKRLEKEFAFLQPFKTKPNATTPTVKHVFYVLTNIKGFQLK